MNYRNGEGYPDPTAGKAIREAGRPPEGVQKFRYGIRILCNLCHVRVLGKITVVDEKGRRW